ncbi:LytS/YhcK type 5TM receptor domain-containing protein [Desulfatitalea alkaliphila]|uniref:histidine kinase n=1 Tax=Desulfatitalea alkaliphila TaxID=2929485 RepID=A0AA41UP49_9BACT|nr:LytS/YhcK type 5TM receptor domain-containing protein [Desulfatitalea alkaliphila]MCJ8500143.1 ATP-binding protein [Desulfatitalea alkaliphila]
MIYLDLIFNLALLVALSVVSAFIEERWPKQRWSGALLQGVLFGGAAVIGMLRPLDLGAGLIFDGRSVMLSLCALFFGPMAATVAALMALACRFWLGGVGMIMGVGVILSSTAVGLVAHAHAPPGRAAFSARYLYLFGLAVHVIMVLLMTTLPWEMVWSTMVRIGVPVIVLYPLATLLAGKILADRAALRASEENYRKLFEDHAAVKLIVEPDNGAILDANHAAARFYGWPRDQLSGMSLARLTVADAQPTAVGNGDPFRYETRHCCADGSERDVAVFSSPIATPQGERLYVIVYDITERKASEERNRKLQEQLHQAQKMESVGRLAGGVAHDFNNMLALIIGHAELALDQAGSQTGIATDLGEILDAGRRSADLTRQLLTFARKQPIDPRVLDLNATLGGMRNMLQRLIGEAIELRWQPGEKLWPVRMDPSQVDQILVNLTVNARDAIDGVGTITIETRNVAIDMLYCRDNADCAPGDYVCLSVSDTGPGMDAPVRAKLFEPFFTTKPVGRGTGLGLATVYGIVTQNQGFITVYSEPGHGARFMVHLPRAPEDATAAPMAQAMPEPARGNETILLVEDETALLKLTRTILTRHGYTVLAAATPEEALALARRHAGPIHLLVTDVVMPGLDGKALQDRLTALRPEIRTLFMSGYTADVIARRGVLDADIDYLQKPFSVAILAAKVRSVLDR